MPLAKAFTCQVLALLVVIALQHAGFTQLGLVWLLGLQALFAVILAALLKQPRWWWLIHLAFLPTVAVFWWWQLPPLLYLGVFLLLLVVFWGTAKGDVPLFLSSDALAQALIQRAKGQSVRHMIELGAGIGSVVVPIAKALPNLSITAVERAPLPWLILRWRCRHLANVQVSRDDFWHVNLAEYDLAFAFLSPLVMPELARKAQSEMRAGSWLISSSFAVPGWKVQWQKTVTNVRQATLFGYRFPRR